MWTFKVKFYKFGSEIEKDFKDYKEAFKFVKDCFWNGCGTYFIIMIFEDGNLHKINYTSEDCFDVFNTLMQCANEIEYIGEEL
jgi:hypothetical protein